jgi:hypothetical protein
MVEDFEVICYIETTPSSVQEALHQVKFGHARWLQLLHINYSVVKYRSCLVHPHVANGVQNKTIDSYPYTIGFV